MTVPPQFKATQRSKLRTINLYYPVWAVPIKYYLNTIWVTYRVTIVILN